MRLDDDIEIDKYLPALVLGHQGRELPTLQRLEEPPPWLMYWQHQYGGYACLQAVVAGLVLPLGLVSENEAENNVVEVLHRLSEAGASRRKPALQRELRSLAPSRGQLYTAQQRATLDQILREAFILPPVTNGREALVQLADADFARTLRNRPVLSHEIPPQCHLDDPDGPHLVIGKRETKRSVDTRLIDHVRAFFARQSLPEPHVFLVWFNSD